MTCWDLADANSLFQCVLEPNARNLDIFLNFMHLVSHQFSQKICGSSTSCHMFSRNLLSSSVHNCGSNYTSNSFHKHILMSLLVKPKQLFIIQNNGIPLSNLVKAHCDIKHVYIYFLTEVTTLLAADWSHALRPYNKIEQGKITPKKCSFKKFKKKICKSCI